MKEFELHTKTTDNSVHVIEGTTNITVFVHKNFMSTGESYRLDKTHYAKLSAYKLVSALVKYAKANQIPQKSVTSRSAPVPAKLQERDTLSPRPIDDVSTVHANANASASEVGRGIFSFTDILHITQHELENTPDAKALLAIKQQNETIYQHCLDTDNIKLGDQDFMQAVAKQIDALTADIARASHICPYCPDWLQEPIIKNGGIFASCCGTFLAYEELSA